MGRSLIIIPTAFLSCRISTGQFKSAKFDGENSSFDVLIDRRKFSPNEFSRHLLTRAGELKDNESMTVNVLRSEQKLSEVATLFRVQRIEDAYTSELHFMLDGNLVVIKLNSYEDSFIAAEEKLVKFMSDFVIADQKKISGFCLGSLAIQGDYSEESGGYYWRDDAGNTFAIEIDTFNSEDPKNLLQRMAGPDSLLSLFNIGHTVLRSRERTVAGMRAYEWLGWTNLGADGDKKTFKFVLETTRPQGTRTTPRITVTFDSAKQRDDGTETTTNLSDAEAMALWDKVVNSIQPAK